MRLIIKITVVAQLFLFLILLFNCGKWAPVVNNSKDIKKLSQDEPSVRARSLVDSDLHSLVYLRNLRHLDFAGGWAKEEAGITDNGLKILSELDLPMLQALILGYNNNITDDGIKYLVRMKSLYMLNLMGCPNITDEGIKNLATMSTLDSLILDGCVSITDEGLKYLYNMKNLKLLSLSGCGKISLEGTEILRVKLPLTRIIKDDMAWVIQNR